MAFDGAYIATSLHGGVGRECGVGRGLGVALGVDVGVDVALGVGVGVVVGVAVALGVGVGVGVGPPSPYVKPTAACCAELNTQFRLLRTAVVANRPKLSPICALCHATLSYDGPSR